MNRGPDNLGVLRYVRDLGESAITVLGNHDLHLIARARGIAEAKSRDTLDDVLDAPDRDELVAWLGSLGLVHREGGHLLVHAGVHPAWSAEESERIGRNATAALHRSLDSVLRALTLRRKLFRSPPEPEHHEAAHAVAALRVLTFIRTCSPDGEPIYDFSGPPEDAPDDRVPWYELRDVSEDDPTILFGHWAALGHRRLPGAVSLDSGCVWGHTLTAYRLEDGTTFQEPSREARRS